LFACCMPPLLILVLLEWVKGRKQAAVKLAGSPASRDSVSEERKKDLVSTIADNFAELSVEDGCGEVLLDDICPLPFYQQEGLLGAVLHCTKGFLQRSIATSNRLPLACW